jgi:GT2 family glycosyltransferase
MTLQTGAVVIPAYGETRLTHAVVKDCLRETDLIAIFVVDNAGDFHTADPRVTVLRPESNLGWLRGTNYGFAAARAVGHDWLVGLNNDTRLCAGFFSGLQGALIATPAALIAPCYDDHVVTQARFFTGPVAAFVPEPIEESALIIDGTCFALTGELIDQLGPLDAKRFGRRGWGGIEDYILRVRAIGGDAYVTHRAYLEHARGSTAHVTMTSYERYATSEMRRGLRRKYGQDWRRHFSTSDESIDSMRVRLGDFLRAVEDRLGLSETVIGHSR